MDADRAAVEFTPIELKATPRSCLVFVPTHNLPPVEPRTAGVPTPVAQVGFHASAMLVKCNQQVPRVSKHYGSLDAADMMAQSRL
jgi:hypothetical protein